MFVRWKRPKQLAASPSAAGAWTQFLRLLWWIKYRTKLKARHVYAQSVLLQSLKTDKAHQTALFT
jgi:hypothetical protein